jgi:hypothetical protein
MNRYTRKLLVLICAVAIPYLSSAWGLLGHRVVGQIAESYLTPKAKLEIKKILGNETLAMSSNWMDFIKSDTSFNYLYNWHFINFKSGLSDSALRTSMLTDTATNAYTKINFLVSELKKKDLAQEKKVHYLRFLVHLVGDIHQPLHVGRQEDQGGNRIKVSWFNEPTNLHHVWDDDLISSQRLSYTEYVAAINFTTKEQRRLWQSMPLHEWIIESYKHAQKIYSGVKPDERLSYRYIYDYLALANERMLKGGVRLAGLLNQIFS